MSDSTGKRERARARASATRHRILATEYVWAERLLDRVKRWAERAKQVALDPRRRRRNQTVAGVGIVGFAAGAWAYVSRWGAALPGG